MEHNVYGIMLSIIDKELLWLEERKQEVMNELNQKRRFREMVLQYKEPEVEVIEDNDSSVAGHE